jgi:hypothetical protein
MSRARSEPTSTQREPAVDLPGLREQAAGLRLHGLLAH